MSGLGSDIRFALRSLLRRPGYLAVILLTLAVGIGVNTAIFGLVNGVLLKPLPYPGSERLILLAETRKGGELSVSYPNYLDWRAQNHVFTSLAAFQFDDYNLVGEGDPERLSGYRVSPEFFETLGVQPLFGRTFTSRDQGPEEGAVVILSHSLWQRRFNGSRKVLGKAIRLNDQLFTVVGVMRPGFDFYHGAELWVPVGFFLASDKDLADRSARGGTYAVGRLKPGVALEQARSEMAAISERLARAYPDSNRETAASVTPLFDDAVSSARRSLLVLLGAVGFVLLIACLNVANLLAVRASGRVKEVAIRTALGASRSRLIRQFLTESLVLALSGGALGLLLSIGLIRLLVAANPGDIPRLNEVSVDWHVLLYPFALGVITGLLFGLVPVLRGWSFDLREQLKEGGEGGGGESRRWNRLREVLVGLEVALCLVLLIGTVFMVESFLNLIAASPGFDYHNVLALNVALPEAKYTEKPQMAAFFTQLAERLSHQPGIQAVGVVNPLPLSGNNRSSRIAVEGQAPEPNGEGVRVDWAPVTPDYFRALGIPLLRGRVFTDQDRGGGAAPGVVIVDETLAHQFWPTESPLGKRLRRGKNDQPWLTVVGVVGHIKYYGLQAESRIQMYLPFAQSPIGTATVVVRTTSAPRGFVAAVRAEVQRLDPALPVYKVRTLEEMFAQSIAQPRFSSLILGLFGVTALLLAVIGVYGMVSYGVSRRTREIGLRMALGAQGEDIRRSVIGQALIPVLAGVAVGVAASLAVNHVLYSLLYNVSPTDVRVFLVVAVILVAAGVVGSFVPALRATRVSPTQALKYE